MLDSILIDVIIKMVVKMTKKKIIRLMEAIEKIFGNFFRGGAVVLA